MDLEELVNSINILEYISQFTEFEQKGKEYFALSPLKDEKTPSFSIDPSLNMFYDFSTGIGGNVLTFIRHYYKCSMKIAVEKLMEYANISDLSAIPSSKMVASMTCKKFSKPKRREKICNSTVLKDNCLDKYIDDKYKLKAWMDEGISLETLKFFEVKYDIFSDRLVYPIRDISGTIVNIGGRTLDKNWKEKKLRKYTYFYQWGSLNLIYGLYQNINDIKKANEIIIFEGAKSVMLARTWGICNTGAILTSHLNPNQMKILVKLGVNIVFALDKDVSIRDDLNIRRLKQFANVEYIWDYNNSLDEKDSPVDKGLETFKNLYSKRLRLR